MTCCENSNSFSLGEHEYQPTGIGVANGSLMSLYGTYVDIARDLQTLGFDNPAFTERVELGDIRGTHDVRALDAAFAVLILEGELGPRLEGERESKIVIYDIDSLSLIASSGNLDLHESTGGLAWSGDNFWYIDTKFPEYPYAQPFIYEIRRISYDAVVAGSGTEASTPLVELPLEYSSKFSLDVTDDGAIWALPVGLGDRVYRFFEDEIETIPLSYEDNGQATSIAAKNDCLLVASQGGGGGSS